ncbi:MAG TPA: HD domain-containing phosphohydrolase [Dissulfurispiraceae bacterium]
MSEDRMGKGKEPSRKEELSFSEIEIICAASEIAGTGRPSLKNDFSFREIEGESSLDLPEKKEPDQNEINELYYQSMYALYKLFLLIKEGRDFSIESVAPYIKKFTASIQKEGNSWMQLIYIEEKEEDFTLHTAVHSLNTAIVAARIGIGLGKNGEELESLATLAFFHDVGMLMVPQKIVLKPGKLTSDEFSHIKKHPEHGHRILQRLAGGLGDIADTIYQEHERHDGSGYPRGLKAGEINEYSFIIGISDIYAAMIQPRPYRPRYLPFDAVKRIIASAKGQFPHSIIKTLVNEFSVFPTGIYVKLNSEEIGRVITASRIAPLRPVIEILYDANGQKLKEPREVDLMRDHVLQIKAACFTEGEMNASLFGEGH